MYRVGLILVACGVAFAQPVSIRVEAGKSMGPLRAVWSFFGHDEPNYTYMKNGKKLLGELAGASSVPVYVRVHSLLVTGDGEPALKWGSTNAYTEDTAGKPVYDWTLTDRIFDTYVERGMKPLVQIGFMPQALSSHPEPYKHHWKPGDNYNDIYTGWAYPPKDYGKWAELVYQWVRHCVAKYGRAEVDTWLWEVWNEPNIGYWKGTPEEFHKLYDYSAAGAAGGSHWRAGFDGTGERDGGGVSARIPGSRGEGDELCDGKAWCAAGFCELSCQGFAEVCGRRCGDGD